MTKVNVEGLERGEVLAALYNSSKPQGLGIIQFIPGDIRASEAEYMFLQGDYFDYLNGRVIKTEIKRGAESIDATLYEKDAREFCEDGRHTFVGRVRGRLPSGCINFLCTDNWFNKNF